MEKGNLLVFGKCYKERNCLDELKIKGGSDTKMAKTILEQIMKAQMGSRGIAVLFL
jgi:hypothetical protein